MKKLTTLLLLFLTIPFYGQWVQQTSGTSENLNDVFCITEDIVVVVGDDGTILKTTNGGGNWVQKTSGTTSNLMKVQFPTATTGYVIGSQASSGAGILLKTIDGGESWSTINLLDMSTIVDISCISDNVLYLNGNGVNNFKLLKSVNGGLTFEIVSTDIISGNKIQFINEQIGYSSSLTEILKTTNGGLTWSEINSATILSFFFLDENIGFVNTNTGLYKTIDGGNNYSYLGTVNSESFGSKLFAITENLIWGSPFECLLNGSPCYSFKGDDTTGVFQIDYGFAFRSIYFTNPTKGYGVAYDGQIYKNSTGNMLNVQQSNMKDTLKIYPNPSSNEVIISLNEISIQRFTVELVDSLGKKVFKKDYNNENNIIINTKSMSKGVYYLTVINQEKRQTQKLIVN